LVRATFTAACGGAVNASTAPGENERLDDSTGLANLQQLVQLRWIAVVGQVVTIGTAHLGFGIPLPLFQMFGVLIFLCIFNLLCTVRPRLPHRVTNGELFFALLVDVGTLTIQLYLSGGATNPFISLYLLQVILGAVLLRAWAVWAMVALTGASFIVLTVDYRPLAIRLDDAAPLMQPYIEGTLVCFALNAALLVIFITRINRNLRARDARLADLRARAVEEENIVRMGLLASGAAHELGTPLSTMSVILGDWRHMPVLAANEELLEEIDEMQAQMARCKRIVSGVLQSAGETRGESAVGTTLRTFLDQLVEEWRSLHGACELAYDNDFGADIAIVSDSVIKQMIYNVLDNAWEASPHWIGLQVRHDADSLRLVVTDRGAGFSPEMLNSVGKPYRSSKGTPGAGLGLFLVSNVARTLKGSVAAQNLADGGAAVTILLPLSSLKLERVAREPV
jgi:two-component system sensor histidine kinase RegB